MSQTTLKRTPLFDMIAPTGKMVDFAGFEMPVLFSSIKEEHLAVREQVGMFDVSHMGELFVTGPDALSFLQHTLSNDISKIVIGQAQYNVLCQEDGGTVDDLLVYRLAEHDYLLVVNASNIEKDETHLRQYLQGDVTLENQSDAYGQIAVQGPKAMEVLNTLTELALDEIKFFRFVQGQLAGVDMLVSRSGYTGEDGFELYMRASDAGVVWQALIEAGVMPCGLGARDTLRFEACLPLYGHELSATISPIEAGMGFAVKPQVKSFVGSDVLLKQKEQGPGRRLIGLELLDKGIARQDALVLVNGETVGFVTTGTLPPTVGKAIALALVPTEYATGDSFEVEVRGKKLAARRIDTPFYRRSK
ncbi:glycine cleavage system aminomethyltransferase GcvT [Exiguobacterium antarcticum]|uniref:glycine cleavage system aminomethyltransferase GcvT n=1 Tax=Exiguobacterium antarcticum TaxID=132920 RepID=UPI000285E688|nr:glycine cleavage system aminomethyltransferase GcvT [Exiguobacterium antarcticum]AFS70002.1 Aminomethyltransferase [Exiguobacterium antarcticum B7]